MIKFLETKDFAEFRNSKEYNLMKSYSLLEGKRIGWNYPLDYTFIINELEKVERLSTKKILDVGCGPGAVHGYLEQKHGVNILGVDMKHWPKDYVDFIGDFTNKEFRTINDLHNCDVIISSSAIEHNSIKNHANFMSAVYESLSPDGLLILTGAANNKKYSTKFRQSFQVNLSPGLVKNIYGKSIENLNKFDEIISDYCFDLELAQGFKERFNKDIRGTLNFLPLGVCLRKEEIPNYKPTFLDRIFG